MTSRNARWVVVIGALSLAMGCKGGGEKEKGGAKKEGPAAAAPLEACVTALETLLDAGGLRLEAKMGPSGTFEPTTPSLPEQMASVARPCKEVLPRCKQDIERLAAGSAVPKDALLACAQLYCPDLPDPEP